MYQHCLCDCRVYEGRRCTLLLESVRGSVRETPRWAGQKVGDNLEEEKGPSLTPFPSVPSFTTLPCRPGQLGSGCILFPWLLCHFNPSVISGGPGSFVFSLMACCLVLGCLVVPLCVGEVVLEHVLTLPPGRQTYTQTDRELVHGLNYIDFISPWQGLTCSFSGREREMRRG